MRPSHVILTVIWLGLAGLGPGIASGPSPELAGRAAETTAGQASSGTRGPAIAGRPGPLQPAAQRPGYEFRRDHDPDGIGKFYFGREIAHVMGAGGIPWLERSEREREEQITRMVESLRLEPGMVAADIGAGSGVITVKLAAKVGQRGKVLAVDIQDEMLSVLSKKLKQLKITNVKTVRGTEKSPNLPARSVDLALMVDVYHEFRFPYEMMRALSRALKPGGRLVFVEYRKEDPKVPIKIVHKMTEAQVKREASLPEFGLRWVETIDVLPRQHIVVFERHED
jgi:ubiquinone/menaquinone biosynthesis C-methylase UbiE